MEKSPLLYLSLYWVIFLKGIVKVIYHTHFENLRSDVKIQMAATATVCSHLKKVAILLFQFKPL